MIERYFVLRSSILFFVVYLFSFDAIEVCAADRNSHRVEFASQIAPLLKSYCHQCHSSDDPNGDVDLALLQTELDNSEHFETWGRVVQLIQEGEMPPEDEPRPTKSEVDLIAAWYQARFVDSVVARPSEHKPRRLSATEYRNTLRSLFGFDLEVGIIEAEQTQVEKSLVMKLLPTDPPGKSGFRNDTHGNPLTPLIWEQYSYLADAAIEELFSPRRRAELAVYAGEVGDKFSVEHAERVIRTFVPFAYRRTVAENELSEIVDSIRGADDVIGKTKTELKVVLMSPKFLYRGLLLDVEPGDATEVDEFELAERLSYFLWSDMPDAELLETAAAKRLRDPDVFAHQIDRMLDSPKAVSLADDFAVQWLALDEIDHVTNKLPLAITLKNQPIEFIQYLFVEDRPLIELIDSRTTFVSPLTRKYYGPDANQMQKYRKPAGIEVEVVPNQRITLENTPGRGGLLTMPGVLAMNRGPVIRGTWILQRILGEHLPEPPANVGQVQPNRAGEKLTFRQRFERHRADKTCAVCHNKIDPLGFALDAYSEDGGFRLAKDYKTNQKNKKSVENETPIDASGRLPSGESFEDFEGLKSILVSSQRENVVRNIVERTLSYALCRKLELHDQPTLERITERLVATDGTYRDMIREIASSLPFQQTIISGKKL